MSRSTSRRLRWLVPTSLLIALIGAGPASATGPSIFISPSEADFANQQIGTTSTTQNAFVQNMGDAPLTTGVLSITGTDASQFSLVGNACNNQVLAPGGFCQFGMRFSPTSIGLKSASVVVPSNDPDGPDSVLLQGTGVNPAVLISPSEISFGNQQIATTSSTQTVFVQNVGNGNGPVTTGALTITGTNASQFSLISNGCNNQVLSPGGFCQFGVRFSPTTIGDKLATVNVPSNDPDGPSAVELFGTGVNPSVLITPQEIHYGNQAIGTSSQTQTVFVQNMGNGNGPINTGTLTITGTNANQFSLVSNGCNNQVLQPGGFCQFGVRFSPTSTGDKVAAVQVPSNDPDGPSEVLLDGTGIPVISTNPSAINFADVLVGETSPEHFVTVTNNGTSPVTVTSTTTGGTHAGDFDTGSDTCTGSAIPPFGGQCFIGVTFTPAARGNRTGTLNIASTGPGSPHVVSLAGRGIAPDISFSPESINFGNVEVGETSPIQTLSITNTGDAPLNVSSFTITGTHAAEFDVGGEDCIGASVFPGDSCQVDLTLAPGGLGLRTATLNVLSNVPGAPRTVSMSGTGIDTTAPASSWQTANNAIVISMLQSVNGTATDAVGVASASVTFTDILGSSITVPATLTCTQQGRNCAVSATVPLMLPGPAMARINATDTSGNAASSAPIMLLVV